MRGCLSHILPVRVLGIALSCCTAACNKVPAAGAAASPASAPSASTPIHGSVCEQNLLSVSDAAGILGIPITGTRPLRNDAQTCYFATAQHKESGSDLKVSLRPGIGRATIGTYTSGRMNEYVKWEPLAGVGESAVWQPDSHEIEAQSGDVLCNASFEFASELFRADFPTQQRKLGAVCNKVFAALRLPTATAASASPAMHGNLLASACDGDIGPADISGLIAAPVEKRSVVTNAQACSYHAQAGATVTIVLASGEDAKFAWDFASNPANGTRESVAGIGDAALAWRSGTDVVARKGSLVCSIDITGTDNVDGMRVITNARGEELAKKLGALCNKVFAARGA